MGQEITATRFNAEDLARFAQGLAAETRLAADTFRRGGFAQQGRVAGFELEAWLLDRNFYPVPCNQSFLARMADPQVVAELSRFNIELNGEPQPLTGTALSRLEWTLADTWSRCLKTAHEDEATAIAIGTLPTLRESDLNLSTMTPSKRYVALNQQVLKARQGRPLMLDIAAPAGGDHLCTTHADVMLEAATTSFQLHLQVPSHQIVRHMNASMVLSGPLIALSANSPFLFGHRLWHETRIPLFEQAVDCGSDRQAHGQRVSFGDAYLGEDPTSYFTDNAAQFPVLLPISSDAPPKAFAHLRLHNGTVWRWNRLLIGFDDARQPHLRIEQRVMPAGPSVIDMIANAAFYYGVVHMLASAAVPPENALPFATTRANFYRAAQEGLDAPLTWLDGRTRSAADILIDLLPMAREGLKDQGIDARDIDRYLDVLAVRLRTRRNGAAWQLAHHAQHGDLFKLTADYLEHQRSGMPVHEWPI
ncbi:MAG TPA: glutamate-cysteine ligase family protein [Aquabacterium sp.]|uniref:glutamate-cysteine ligase family protein n=1 Tax=Aquabacterium sp. TaxID=1872578 RepID=UPI002E33E4A9|nr:glutamate-cysteine ligase family protein [Aquabacterium sp.]HEX5355993.1 glutamate-cysteine ligase family protein [Aquabacterium sp.]